MTGEVIFRDIPGEQSHENDSVVLKTRVNTAWQHYLVKTGLVAIPLHVSTGEPPATSERPTADPDGKRAKGKTSGPSLEERAAQYQTQVPLFTFDQLIVPDSVKKNLILAARIIDLEGRVFDDWGLRKVEPFPRSALNFYGEPGTGKTLAAHAMASLLGRKILLASYGQIESMYHGEGPKNVEAVFHAAQHGGALLFIDEADSLLSKRLTNVTQGSEQAINSMRSQLLLCLERFKGVVVFATNLIKNYDKAFETRVRNIEFPMPDLNCRRRIWATHLPAELPLADDVSPEELAEVETLCGREIRNAVIEAALQAAMNDAPHVSRLDLIESIQRVKLSRIQREDEVVVHTLTEEEQEAFDRSLQGASHGNGIPTDGSGSFTSPL
jgi:AAA+ superfamily predicted ATPase